MRRILFVDDDSKALAELQRSLQPMRQRWEMSFANTGDVALAMLCAAPFDVIVSDMYMPKMDGATLLQRVRDLFPNLVRILLASQAEFGASLRAVPVAHQFLLKPCNPDLLRVGVERACSLSAVLSNDLLRGTIGSMGDLPALPRTYAALMEELQNPNSSVERLARIVEQDVAISAKVLQLVNSALFSLMREIATVRTAVSFLGIDMLKDLVLSVEVAGVFRPSRPIPGFSLEEVQLHAHLSAKIAGRLPAPKHLSEMTMVAALLHDVGQLVLASKLPDQLARVWKTATAEKRPLYAVESEVLGVTHAEIGAYLLGLWGLPTPIMEAVAHHHDPTRVPAAGFDVVAAVYVADALAHEHILHSTAERVYDPLDMTYLEGLHVTDKLPAWHAMAGEIANDMDGKSETVA